MTTTIVSQPVAVWTDAAGTPLRFVLNNRRHLVLQRPVTWNLVPEDSTSEPIQMWQIQGQATDDGGIITLDVQARNHSRWWLAVRVHD